MMTMRDAEPMDVYVDEHGKLWRVVGTFGEPSVIMEEIESKAPESPVRKTGGVNASMWMGWERIHRPLKPKKFDPKEFEKFERKSFLDSL